MQRVVFWSRYGDSFTVYGVVLSEAKKEKVRVLALYDEVTTGIWDKHECVPTGRTFDLTPIESVLRGC